MLVAQASRSPAFRFERGALVQDLIRENGRVAGVRLYSPDHQPRELRADYIIGADGRGSALRRLAGLQQERLPQAFDVVWCKVPLPDSFENGTLARVYIGHGHFAFMFPAADGRLQLAWIIHKGTFGELSRQGMDQWIDDVAGHVDPELAAHFRRHRQDVTHPFLLNVVCDHLDRWTVPGLLLIGDASHPMSPVGAQGINIALRDALVAANHLIPVLTGDASPEQLDAAGLRVQAERLPEVIAVQKLQQGPPRVLFQTAWWSGIALTVLPWLLRAGLAQRVLGPTLLRFTQGVTTVTLTEPRR
jgi:2-polyprenyl-6-methoxyphenol hydroxylase-like FAD-dependent oxidoreductase